MRLRLFWLAAAAACTAGAPIARDTTAEKSQKRAADMAATKPEPPHAEPTASEFVLFDHDAPAVPPNLPVFSLKPFDNRAAYEVLRSRMLPQSALQTKASAPRARPRNSKSAVAPRFDGDKFEIYASFEDIAKEELGELNPETLLEKAKPGLMNLVSVDKPERVVVDSTRVLRYAQVDQQRGTLPKEPVAKLIYVALRRRIEPPQGSGLTVNDLPVDGPGSRIVVALDARGAVRSAVFDWKRAVEQTPLAAPERPRTLQKEIRDALQKLAPKLRFHVRKMEWVYYDTGDSLQPVLRYVAEPRQGPESIGGSDHFVGYLPYNVQLQDPTAIPSINRESKPAATDAQATSAESHTAEAKLLLGRFVLREDVFGFGESSATFLSTLNRANGPLAFSDARWSELQAEPPQFVGDEKQFIDGVDFALVEAHGYPWGFVTKGDSTDPVSINREMMHGPGYGVGKLRHWLLHSCESVPAADDDPNEWHVPWWKVFKGLSSVIGYRSSMFVADGAPAALAPSLRWGAAVVPAWFNAVASLNMYAGDSSSASFRCAGEFYPMGRASALTVCGHANATASVDPGPGEAKCLEAWWFADALSPEGRAPIPLRSPPPDCPIKGGPASVGGYKPHG